MDNYLKRLKSRYGGYLVLAIIYASIVGLIRLAEIVFGWSIL